MIRKAENLSKEELKHIQKTIGEAFVPNEMFHNWGTEADRHDDVLKYMQIYVDYVYRIGELYVNEDLTGFIGLENSTQKPSAFQGVIMLLKMFTGLRPAKVKSLLRFSVQVSRSNERFAKQSHLDALFVCVDKEHQGKGIASELIRFAMDKADELDVPLLFDTDMEAYARMYQHFGCELYNTVTADNGVTRYSLVHIKN